MGEKGNRRKRVTSARPCGSVPVVKMPITDAIDLHTFSPAELEPLIGDYIEECLKKGISQIRIIHGKGKGIQRRRVQSLLSQSPLVESYHDADPGGGGWGGTIAVLKKAHPHIPNAQ